MKRWLPYLIVAAVATIGVAAGVVLYRAVKPPALQATRDSTAAGTSDVAHTRGPAGAPVTLEEFGDFQCPPCGILSEPLNQIERDFAGKVRLIFRQFPLDRHPHAHLAAYAAEAAGLQNRFWEMHDLLYRNQNVWSQATVPEGLFVGYAKTLGLETEKFRRDLHGPEVKERVAADQYRARKLGVEVTPTVFLNGKNLTGLALGPAGVRSAVEAALADKSGQP